jgi:hypothetical protein
VYAVYHGADSLGPYVVRSDDGGKRWSDPVHVAVGDRIDQRGIYTMAVNRDGILAVSWHDRGSDPASTCWNVFVAFSADGESFTEPRRISTEPSCPAAGLNAHTAEWKPLGGDYSGLAAAADGAFHLLWPDSRGQYYELRTAPVRVTR